jgi:peptide/nickel transport system ATP-binding protein
VTAYGRSPGPLLTIDDLTVAYRTAMGIHDVVRDVRLSIEPGQTYGLVGESGSGKSTIALAVLNYLPGSAVIRKGRIAFDGQDLLRNDHRAMRELWGRKIGYVPQDPHASLNPSLRVGDQVKEVLIRSGLDRQQAEERVLSLLGDVRLPDPSHVARSYPHQISGGMKQRVLIAMALSREPSLLVMDEPTTGLDATTQASILDLIGDLVHSKRTAILYVSHNLGVVAQICDRVAVLYAGELMEDAPSVEIYRRPLHPYTQGLLDSVPRLGQNKRRVSLRAIGGLPPSPYDRPSGCIFMPRCPLVIDICNQHPRLFDTRDGHQARCHRWAEIRDGSVEARQPARSLIQRSTRSSEPQENLEVHDVTVEFPVRRSMADVLARRPMRQLRAVNGVSLSVRQGRALGLVGESGSGKTTLASTIMGLVERTDGQIRLLGRLLPRGVSGRDRETLSRLQMIFQDVDESLIPTMTVGATLTRTLTRIGGPGRRSIDSDVGALIKAVRLPPETIAKFPRQLSGGERQRVAIARAIASKPDLLVADEPVSSLDVSVQAAVLNLLDELQVERNGSLLFISHDLAVVGFVSDMVAVIYLGSLMQLATAGEIFDPPYHPYTEALLSAIPLIDPQAVQARVRLQGETPSPIEMPSGCPFHTRCPRFLGDICRTQSPPEQRTETGGTILCHIPVDELRAAQRRAFGFSGPVEGVN